MPESQIPPGRVGLRISAKSTYSGHPQKVQKGLLRVLKVARVSVFSRRERGVGRDSSCQRPRIDRVDCARAPACVFNLRRQPIEVDQQIETGLHLVSVGKVRPALLVNVAKREAVREFALADPRKDGFRRRRFRLAPGRIGAARMGLQIFGERQRPQRRGFGNGAHAPVRKVSDKREARDEFAIFR